MFSMPFISQTPQWQRLAQLTDTLSMTSARRQREQFQLLIDQRSRLAYWLLPQATDLPTALGLLTLIRADRQAEAQRYVARLLQQQPVACSAALPALTLPQLLLLATLTAAMTPHNADVALLLRRVHRLSEQAHNALTVG